MTEDPRLTALSRSLPSTVPFVGPETQERARGRPFAARLGANESGFGPSPKAIDALQKAASDIWKYPDPESHELRHAIAAHIDVAPENIMVGEGIDTLLGVLVRLTVTAGDRVVTSDGAYPTFNYHVAGFGGVLEKVPYASDHEDPDRLVATAKDCGAKLIYFANPDNPMGTYHSAKTVEDMVHSVPSGALLVLDEAYIEFAPEGTAPRLDPDDQRVIRMRTFSKAYGLAGARVGYAIGPKDLIRAFNKVRNHFGMNRVSQVAALAALADQDWLKHVCTQVDASRMEISRIAVENGLKPIPSATNFVAIDCGQDGGFARKVLSELLVNDIFVRMPFISPQDRCVRVSCGPAKEMAAFEAALPKALKAAAKSKE